MDNSRETFLNEKPIKMMKMPLIDCNQLIVPVMNSVSKFSMGESDLFLHWKPSDFSTLYELMCKYMIWRETGKNVSLLDICDDFVEFMGLSFEFLEFNYGFFSQARKILARLNGQLSEKKEKTKEPLTQNAI